MYKILISDKFAQEGLDLLDEFEDVSYEMITNLSKDELISTIPDYDALIVRSGTRPDADVIAAASNLKVIGRAGVGVDNIDIEAATKHGVMVMNTPDANSVATAEQTLTLMLAISRHTIPAHNSLAAGEWERSAFTGTELHKKTLGVIGFGRIGRLVTQRAQAFGMNVITYDPFVAAGIAKEYGVQRVSLDNLYAKSDYITLHTVITKDTTQMINKASLAKMKDGVIIVNVARGQLVNETDLAEALKSGKVRAAALDVYTVEPPDNSPLINLPNVVHTPHLGASTAEAQLNVSTQMVEQVVDALRGVAYRNVINDQLVKDIDPAH